MSEINDSFELSVRGGSIPIKLDITFNAFKKNIILSYGYTKVFEKQLGFLANKGGETFIVHGTSFQIKWLWNAFREPKSIVIVDPEGNIVWTYKSDEANAIEADRFTPGWAWIFVVACGLLFVISGGGAIPSAIGTMGALTCFNISRDPEKSTVTKFLQCVGVTSGAWVLAFAIAAILLSILQPDRSFTSLFNFPEQESIPDDFIQELVLTPNEGVIVSDRLRNFGDEIIYEFEVTEVEYDLFWLVNDYSSSYVTYRIIAADGSERVTEATSMSERGATRYIPISEPGTYQIIVYNGYRKRVNFEAELWYVVPVFQTIELAQGDAYEFRGTIEFPGQRHYYQIELGEIGGLSFERPSQDNTPFYFSYNPIDFAENFARPLRNLELMHETETYYIIFLVTTVILVSMNLMLLISRIQSNIYSRLN